MIVGVFVIVAVKTVVAVITVVAVGVGVLLGGKVGVFVGVNDCASTTRAGIANTALAAIRTIHTLTRER